MAAVKLSVIIVSYNVRYFLEQCLHSVFKASSRMAVEVFVVDNDSSDDSCSMVKEKFPAVTLIENKQNVGFSAANNQAIKLSQGEYILLLNPDTIVQEDTFEKIIDFMDHHPDAGGLGVKMIDGNGKFLPESKRGLPTPLTAFYKIFGLSSVFPKSKVFGKYHLTYLDNNQIHSVDVLSGAFMLLRRSVLDTIGLLDETFFMYGEDIDLSYRITLAGYKNYYFPLTTIVHYKGESTKKNSLNYVKIFYDAMKIFYDKHFHGRFTFMLTPLIKTAIYFRAFLAILRRIFQRIWIPIVDIAVIWLFFIAILPIWEQFKFGQHGIYPHSYLNIIVPIYLSIMTLALIFSGGYDNPYRHKNFVRGIFIGFGSILLFYSLLNEQLRFSRAMILFSMTFAALFLPLLRYFYAYIGIHGYSGLMPSTSRILLAGSEEEAKKTLDILGQRYSYQIVGRVSNDPNDRLKNGTLNDLSEVARILKADEIIFCSTNFSISEIINSMMNIELVGIKFKIATPDNVSIIGSSTIITEEPLFDIEINSISTPMNRRLKRTFDLLLALFIVIFFPVVFFTFRNPLKAFSNAWRVMHGKRTWVGYIEGENAKLPRIPPGILTPLSKRGNNFDPSIAGKVNFIYAKDYKIFTDLKIVLRNWTKLGL
ncbi:MAG TPA: glycosyltransferase [Salinivirgaceae bacterium]|nr:glycosyltransferase [Salinivirgaceae bacterium]